MSPPASSPLTLPLIAGLQPVARVVSPSQGLEVTRFLLQPGLFATPLTPGELDDFQHAPLRAASHNEEIFWYLCDSHQAIAGVMGIREHANRTGIYQIIAFAIDPASRHQGLGRRLLCHALGFLADIKARGLLFDTSSHPSYLPMQKLLLAMQFRLVGRFPDFYYPGEDTLWYYRSLELPLQSIN